MGKEFPSLWLLKLNYIVQVYRVALWTTLGGCNNSRVVHYLLLFGVLISFCVSFTDFNIMGLGSAGTSTQTLACDGSHKLPYRAE